MINTKPIEMALRVAQEYGTKDSQIDGGNLYAALRQCLDRIDVLESRASDEEAEKFRTENENLKTVLHEIHSYAHDHSTGPTVPDALWEIRRMAAAVI